MGSASMSRTNKLKLLGSASAFAFVTVLGGAVDAAPLLSPVAPAVHSVARQAIGRGDPLVELALRSGGQLTAERIAALLPAVIGPLSAEKAEMLPALMEAIRGLGLGGDAEAAALETMTGLIAEAGLQDGDAARLMHAVADRFTARIQLARVQNGGKDRDGGKDRHNDNHHDRGHGSYRG
ncbi:MAG: hypothetical protein U1E53_27100 [Dongiaceae bacterium]